MSSASPLKRLLSVISEFRQLKHDIQAETVEVFCLIAENPGITAKEIQIHTGLSQSSVSRHLALLSDNSWNGAGGLDLVDYIEDPADRRTKRNFLKHRGRTFALKITSLIDPSASAEPSDFPLAKEYLRMARRG